MVALKYKAIVVGLTVYFISSTQVITIVQYRPWTRPDGRMSKASVSHFGASVYPELNDLKNDTCYFVATHSALLDDKD